MSHWGVRDQNINSEDAEVILELISFVSPPAVEIRRLSSDNASKCEVWRCWSRCFHKEYEEIRHVAN